MSQENVEVVRGAYDRFIRELTAPTGEEDLVDFLDPEVVLDVTRRVLNPAIYHGYAGILQGRDDVSQAWSQWTIEPERLIDAGEEVVAVETISGRGRGSGVEIADRSATKYTLHKGKITQIVVYFDLAEALAAVGLSE